MSIDANNRLPVLAAGIRAEHCAIVAGSHSLAGQVIAAGRMLIEAKAAVPYGEWDAWLRDLAGLSPRTARRYMQVARSGLEAAIVAEVGIVGAARTIAKLRPERGVSANLAETSVSDPPYLAWQAEVLADLDRAPNPRARRVMLAMLAASVEAA